jgi:DhnA family fructose-bisphosphate aldolase class Ia
VNAKEFRLRRFLGAADKLVVAAMDHGAFHGPIPGLVDPRQACMQLKAADAVLMASGMISHVADILAGPEGPWLITRLVWNSSYCFQWKHFQSQHRPMLSVAQAIAAGADIVLASLAINTGSEQTDAENASLFSRCVQQAAELGVPIIGEYYPAGTDNMTPDQLHDNIRIGCRVAAELGADIIKTFYTGPRFAEVAAGTPVPILVLGAEKTPTERDALALAARAAEGGARGIVFGRNIFQSRNPAGFIQALRAILGGKSTIDAALKTYGFEKA